MRNIFILINVIYNTSSIVINFLIKKTKMNENIIYLITSWFQYSLLDDAIFVKILTAC